MSPKSRKTLNPLKTAIPNVMDAQKLVLQYHVFPVNTLHKRSAIGPDSNVCQRVKKVFMLMATNAKNVPQTASVVHRPKNV